MENTKKSQTEPNDPRENQVKSTVDDYNSIPVHYCTKCMSLRVFIFNEATDYCDVCGCTEIATSSIEDYLKLKQDKNIK